MQGETMKRHNQCLQHNI